MSDIQTEYLEGRIHELEEQIEIYDAIKDVSLTKDLDRIAKLEEAIRNHEKEEYSRVPMNFDMNDQTLWRIGANHPPRPIKDPATCPKCGGEPDNGFDRCMPPHPYHCSKCAPVFKESK